MGRIAAEFHQGAKKLPPREGIQGCGRLIKDQQFRAMAQRQNQSQLL